MATVLMVCSGNLCRSPVAAMLLTQRLDGDVRVRSAGTAAPEGAGIPRQMRRHLRADGIDPRPHRARRLTRAMIDAADLIVPMAHAQWQYIALMTPDAASRTFMLTRLATLAREAPTPEGTSVSERVAAVPELGTLHLGPASADNAADIPDPYGGPSDMYRESYEQIRTMVDTVATWLEAPAGERSTEPGIPHPV
ncbi:arsenate reductase/protein-tyrosine-phosphatase family protein [Demequina subtropica]|uniref:arsenate reductase/protein-tyrosine-phosphatase family protein n=1 Tax=Demequina subtropica TaxID=1638989 RepID=UPI000782CE4A|nr:low molecular weight phosphatase family protein [Demequina subtropica]